MKTLFSILLLALLVGSPGLSGATAWHVEQDGTGDWTTIHAAVQAAADGDTILIGAGRWSNFFPTWSGAEGNVYWTDDRELYLIGSGVGNTIIGPEEYTQSSLYSVGLEYGGSSAQHFRGISFENMDYGMMCSGVETDVTDCGFDECEFALGVYDAEGGEVRDCSFSFSRSWRGDDGLIILGSSNVVIEGCDFRDMGIYHSSSYNSTIRRCSFHIHLMYEAAYFANAGSAVFESNELDGGTVYAALSGSLEIRDNVFLSSSDVLTNLRVIGHVAEVVINHNEFRGGWGSSIVLDSASLSGTDNDIVNRTGGDCIHLYGYNIEQDTTVDLRNNYWGTSDPDSIAAWIWDGNDDPAIQQTVQFEPFSAVSLPAENRSLDSFKSLFR